MLGLHTIDYIYTGELMLPVPWCSHPATDSTVCGDEITL